MNGATIASLSEETLLEKAAAGDADAFAEIVRCHQKKVYRVALAILRDEADADLVAQDTFIKASRHLSRFEGRSGLETWLVRIAINRSRDLLRKRKRRSEKLFAGDGDPANAYDPADDRPDPERAFESTRLREAIARSLDLLSDQQRTVFQLRHLEGLPLEEIATMLDLSPGTVRAHLFRAIHKVREALRPWSSPANGGAA